MKNSLLKKSIGLAAVVCTGVAALALAPAAHAVLPTTEVAVAAGGSDTIQNFMGTYLDNFNGSTTVLPGKTIRTYNVPAFPTPTYSVPGDVNCIQDVTWNQTAVAADGPAIQKAPSGSGAGKTYLAGENAAAVGQKGCIDISRSSSAPGTVAGGEKASFEYYAFALDAVTWSTPSLQAPAIMTRQNVQDIYSCNVTDWGTVGGTPGPIQRYLPQTGSGTRSFFLGQYGITAAMLATVNANCPAVKDNSILNNNGGANIKFEENQGVSIESGDIAKAILPYSAGVWSFQSANSSNPTVDLRNGVRLGGINAPGGGLPAVKGNPVRWVPSDRVYALDNSVTGVVIENHVTLANPALTTNDFPGVRYVFNILDNAGNLQGYQAGFNMVGFNNVGAGAKSPLCSNNGASDDQQFAFSAISTFGFAPLGTTGGPAGSNNAGATCRKFAPS